MTIFCPAKHQDIQLGEFDIDEILDGGFRQCPSCCNLNIHFDRYELFQKSRVCACCGIQANRCFLEFDEQNKVHHFNFYAETGHPSGDVYLILLTRDHIIPKSNGGSEDLSNAQTLCFNCNCFKGASGLSLEQMQSSLFPAYRAYKSSVGVREAKKVTRHYLHRIEGCRRTIVSIMLALESINDERVERLRNKIAKVKEEMSFLQKEVQRIELQAQITGNVPAIR